MKKQLFVAIPILAVLLAGCGNAVDPTTETVEQIFFEEFTQSDALETEESASVSSETTSAETQTASSDNVIEFTPMQFDLSTTEAAEKAAWEDYTEDIRAEVDAIVTTSASLQEEMTYIEALATQYESLRTANISQQAMNVASQWAHIVWDTELQSLKSRIDTALDDATKAPILGDLQKWEEMKEEAVVLAIGTQEDGGSIYPMEYQMQLESMTRKKAYSIAYAYATAIGEAFTLPQCPMYGVYVNDEGTSEIYDSLAIVENYAGEAQATIRLYKFADVEGSITMEDDHLVFRSYDGNMTGTITYNRNSAQLIVTSCSLCIHTVGDTYDFYSAF
ncbi:MAG: hypothetical protein K6G23_08025 [Lachnospiraceae bacterium]|nr:hypothetical protein [Lachnospiraceae bacterium]